MTLPNYYRCFGRLKFAMGVQSNFRHDYPFKEECVACLRRTVPAESYSFTHFITPPDFTTTCPERIAPCQ